MSEKKTILLADDDVQLVDSIKTLLESVGYDVYHVYQSQKVVDNAKAVKPDLIVLDVMFAGPKGPDGFELSRQLSKESDLKNIPVIILSGIRKTMELPYAFEPDATWMPVKAFLEKPIKPDKLLSEIEKILGPRE